MKILYLTSGFPFPLTSGYLRHYFLIKELACHHSCTLLSLVGGAHRSEHAAALRPYCEDVQVFRTRDASPKGFRSVIDRAQRVCFDDPAQQRMARRARELTAEGQFDAVICSGGNIEQVIRRIEQVPIIADVCDAAVDRVRMRMRFARPSELPRLWLESHYRQRVERLVVQRSAHQLFASCRDRDAVVGRSSNATVIPNGVDADFWRRRSTKLGDNTIVFSGAMHYPPNVDAAVLLIDEILPRVRRAIPEAQLFIAGRDPAPCLEQRSSQDGVHVTGYVTDMREYLERATVFAAPLRFSAGIQNKLLEAMAMEVPVIASSAAADGLRTEAGDRPPLRVAEDCETFAAAIIRELRERSADRCPDEVGRGYVQRHFDWRRSGAMLERVLRSVAGVTRAAQAPASATARGTLRASSGR